MCRRWLCRKWRQGGKPNVASSPGPGRMPWWRARATLSAGGIVSSDTIGTSTCPGADNVPDAPSPKTRGLQSSRCGWRSPHRWFHKTNVRYLPRFLMEALRRQGGVAPSTPGCRGTLRRPADFARKSSVKLGCPRGSGLGYGLVFTGPDRHSQGPNTWKPIRTNSSPPSTDCSHQAFFARSLSTATPSGRPSGSPGPRSSWAGMTGRRSRPASSMPVPF